MLRLDKLEIRGFKSFCDFTEVVFHEGITAIVGPNGCGKSNIVDAITWVLGEQSAKNLRGGKMEDVVFNGTRDRKPVGMAEVLLTFTAVADIVARNDEDDRETFDDSLPTIDIEAADVHIVEELPPANLEALSEDQPIPEAKPVKRRAPRPRIPTLLAGEKITIGRRLYRSGDSDYLMNGRQCRLRDIQDFFSGTGLSRAHYAIVEQGRIGQVLSSKPYDRRALIEEAAGISRFKAKRHQAELKLEATRQNLSRLNDLISEIERQIASLKRQAAKSRRFKSLRDELRNWQRIYFLRAAANLTEAQKKTSETLAVLTNEHEKTGLAVTRVGEESTAARAAARNAEDALATLRQSASTAELEFDRATNLIKHLTEQLHQVGQRRKELANESGHSAERRKLLDGALEQSRKTNQQLSEELTADETRLKEAEQKHRDAQNALHKAELELEQLRNQLLTHLTRTERLRNQQEQLQDSETRLARQGQNLENENKRAAERKATTDTEYHESLTRQQETQGRVSELKNALQKARTETEAAETRLRQVQQRLGDLQRQRTRGEDRMASLKDLDNRHTYYSGAVQTLLNNAKSIPNFTALGTLADFLTVADNRESLVESVLGERVQAIVVPTVGDAVTGADWLENRKAGRATFLVTGVQGGSNGASAASATSPELNGASFLHTLGLPEHLKATFQRAYPLFADATLTENLPEAISLSAETSERLFITPKGEQVLGCTLVVTGGGAGEPKSVLNLKRDIRDLASEIEKFTAEIQKAAAEVEIAETAVTEARQQRQNHDAELRSAETALAAVNVETTQRKREADRAVQHCNVIAAEQKQLAEEEKQLKSRQEQNVRDLEEAVRQREQAEASAVRVQQTVAELRPALEKAAQELSEIRALVAGRLERRRAASSELRRLEQERQEAERAIGQLNLESADAAGRETQLTQQRDECAAQIDNLKQAVETLRVQVVEAERNLESTRKTADELEGRLSELHILNGKLRDRRSALEVESAKLASDFEYLQKDCRTELNVSLEEIETVEDPTSTAIEVKSGEEENPEVASPEPVLEVDRDSVEALAERIAALKSKIENLGPINMLALDELEEAEKRQVFLTGQRADILDSMATTEEALKEIRKRTKQRFLEAFNQINEYFAVMFQELFGGGRGEMILIDPEDVLESGIDIVAQPPGKRLQSVLLLSGGEKAMVAMALIMSIFRYRPSPFCVLDEVDAPLDEANIDRFTNKVAEMSLQTQFIVVTHNKRTMEAANSIYGVSMPEPGVSKLLSVKFDSRPEPVASGQ